ncbi:tRNA (N6-isopentenyl adenosine(37)-C2)-methylthiotransferase MiaB, partial [bacterium]|nr:tRNA (N6-isopentenyl adenosine(37)-C2)-methylthiotransferase MiaB [bacterium]
MNKYDSELVASILTDMGYEEATKKSDATLLLVNTCSVRETAESRALGRLSALNKQKLKNPNVIIGLLGCMAQRIGPQILEKKPFVNFALGPDDYRQLPDILKKVGRGTQRQQEFKIDVTDFEDYANIYPLRVHGVSAWVAIMRGCNNFCTYCIVPYLRGRERSRRLDNILEEVKNLTADGFKEVTLLGQNVNSYLDENTDFPELLRHVCRIDGIERIRFASSHPKDFSPELIQVMAEEPKVCNHIHLALQAGSNRVLKRMQRNYTREHFLSLLTAAREQVPGISFTTDVIVGFPGETDADFEETLSLVKEARFDNAFTFKFNPREGTQAASMTDDVSAEEKQRRLEALIVLQNEIT